MLVELKRAKSYLLWLVWGLSAVLVWQSRAIAQESGVRPPGQPGDTQDAEGYAGFVRRVMPPLPADAPKPSNDPRDLEGTWFHRDLLEKYVSKNMYGGPVPINEDGKKVLDHRVTSLKSGKPIANASTRCIPPGHPWQLDLNMPFTILNDKNAIYFLFEEFHGVWKVRMNQAHQPQTALREYMGDSVGHWDGGTLVVDTVNFKEPMWVDVTGEPLSTSAHLIHRIRKIDDGGPALEIITTVDDPQYYTTRWSMVRSFAWRPDKAIFAEYNCEEQVGAPDSVASYGVVEER
jgi:uncharacterized protein YukJ